MDATRVPLRLFQGKRHRIPLTCGPASRSLHPIFRLPLGASGRSHRRACPQAGRDEMPLMSATSLRIEQGAHRLG
jgi:hypothetical protein